jgi:hypothetical protein
MVEMKAALMVALLKREFIFVAKLIIVIRINSP